MVLNLLIGPIANLASTWLEGKVEQKKAEVGAKVAKSNAEAAIMQKKAAGEIDWDIEMAKGSQSCDGIYSGHGRYRREWFQSA